MGSSRVKLILQDKNPDCIRVNTLSITNNSFLSIQRFSKMATSMATANAITVIQVNDHEISSEDATWQAFKGSCDEQQPATFWTRINRMVKDAFGYSTGVSGIAIQDSFNA